MLDDLIKLLQNGNLSIEDYQYFDSLFNHRTILWNQEVNESVVEKLILPLMRFEADESMEPVTLIFSTIGGSVSDSFVLCNIIDNYKKPLTILVLGYAASMGTIILAAGAHNPNVVRKCYPFSYSLLHAGSTSFSGESLTVQDTLEFNKKLDDKVKHFIITHTNITEEEYTIHERKQWFLDAEDMKRYGFIDEIIGEEDDKK